MQTIGSSACGALRRSAIDFAESRLEIRRPTSAGAELPDQRSVFCERWCARRCRSETVVNFLLEIKLHSRISGFDPYVNGFTSMVNSVYNGWRFEDVWLDR